MTRAWRWWAAAVVLVSLASVTLAQTSGVSPPPTAVPNPAPPPSQLLDGGTGAPSESLPGQIDAGAPFTIPDAGELVPLPNVTVPDAGAPGFPPGQPPGPPPPIGLVPPALRKASPAKYPEALAEQGVRGEVKLELSLDERGEVVGVLLVESVHPLLDDAAETAAKQLRFEPAREDGKPIAVRVPFTYHFDAPEPRVTAVSEPAPPKLRATVRGLVRARGNRRPVVGATLRVEGASPVESDVEGRFTLEVPPGSVWIRVSAPGHKARAFREQLEGGEAIEVIYGLEPLQVNPYETVVRGDRARTEVSRVELSGAELREVPGTMGDPFRVITLLPGVATPMSGLAYPIVRGSQPAATGYFIDGIRVPVLFHLFLGPSVVHPDFIDGIDFYPGAPPAEFGRNLGGVIQGNVTRPREDRLHGTAYLDFINAGLFVEQPFSTGTSVSLSGRVSYTGWLVSLAASHLVDLGENPPQVVLEFYDYQARIEQRLGPARLRLLAFGSSDVFGIRSTGPQSTGMLPSIVFHRIDLRYQTPLGKRGELELGATWGVDHLGMEGVTPTNQEGSGAFGTGAGAFGFSVSDVPLLARAKASFELGEALQLSVGSDVEHRQSQMAVRATLPTPEPGQLVEVDAQLPLAIATFTGAWAELRWRPDRWRISPSLRFDNYHLRPGRDFQAIEPRLTVRRELSDSLTLKGGAGLFHMPPTTLINVPAISLAGLKYGLQQGLQLDVGAEWKVLRGLEVTADAYVNPLLRAIEIDPFSLPAFEPGTVNPAAPAQPTGDVRVPELENPTTRGLSYGLDLMVRHPLGANWFGWLSYSFNNSWRRATFRRLDDTGLEYGDPVTKDLPFLWEQAHVFNGVISYKFPGDVTLGLVAHFNTGRPEAGGASSTTHVVGRDPASSLEGWVPVDPDRVDRLPSFFRIDVRAAKAWAFDTFALEVYLDVLNATLSREVISYTYQNEGLAKTPLELPVVLPSIGVKGSY